MSPILDIAADLAAAADRLAAITARRRRLRLGILTSLGSVAVVGVATAATGLWTPQVGSKDDPGLISRTAPPTDIVQALGILRREQTAADRGAESKLGLRYQGARGKVRVGHVRLLGHYRGQGYVLIPVEGGKTDPLGRKQPRNQVCVSARDGDGIGLGCFGLADIRAGRAVMGIGPPPRRTEEQLARLRAQQAAIQRRHPEWKLPPITQPSGQRRAFGIVPDGVATIRIGKHPPVRVKDNFFQILGQSNLGPPRFFDARGHEIAK